MTNLPILDNIHRKAQEELTSSLAFLSGHLKEDDPDFSYHFTFTTVRFLAKIMIRRFFISEKKLIEEYFRDEEIKSGKPDIKLVVSIYKKGMIEYKPPQQKKTLN